MTTQDDHIDSEPLPTPMARQQEPEFDTRGTWQAYQREHYTWRTGMTPASAEEVPADEGEPPKPTATQVALELFLGLLGSGPGVSIGKGMRPGVARPAFRPAVSRPSASARPAPSYAKAPGKPIAPPTTAPGTVSNGVNSAKAPGPVPGNRQASALYKLLQAHRSTGWRKAHKPAPAATQSSESPWLESLFKQRAQSNTRATGQLESIAELQALDFEVPGRVYRAHQGDTVLESASKGLRRAAGGNLDGDDHLAAIIKHSARQGGSAGEVLSLSADKSIANKFARGRKAPVFEIDTSKEPHSFRTMTDILLNDSERLVLAKKVTRATVLHAADNIAVHQESEVFYIKGDIPSDYLVIADGPAATGA